MVFKLWCTGWQFGVLSNDGQHTVSEYDQDRRDFRSLIKQIREYLREQNGPREKALSARFRNGQVSTARVLGALPWQFSTERAAEFVNTALSEMGITEPNRARLAEWCAAFHTAPYRDGTPTRNLILGAILPAIYAPGSQFSAGIKFCPKKDSESLLGRGDSVFRELGLECVSDGFCGLPEIIVDLPSETVGRRKMAYVVGTRAFFLLKNGELFRVAEYRCKIVASITWPPVNRMRSSAWKTFLFPFHRTPRIGMPRGSCWPQVSRCITRTRVDPRRYASATSTATANA